jgi:hypothetical protein
MSILSLTFHAPAVSLNEWEKYSRSELTEMVNNLFDVEKYILSDVESDMISEGRNTNLLLLFDNDELRASFLENELENISDRIGQRFGEEIMIFQTLLNSFSQRI